MHRHQRDRSGQFSIHREFPTGSSGQPTALLVYNWKADRWAHGLVSCEMIYSGATQQSWTLEDLNVFVSIELVPFSLDSSYWTGSRQLLLRASRTTTSPAPSLEANLEATLDTGEFQPIPGRRARILGARPLIDGGTPTIAVATRRTQQQPITWSSPRTMTPDGKVPLRREGRYMRLRATVADLGRLAVGASH